MFASRSALNRIVFSAATVVGVGTIYSLKQKRNSVIAMSGYAEYHVDQISDLPRTPPARIIDSLSFPPDLDISDVVTTEISLWEVDSNVDGFFSLSYWRSLFNRKKDYNIILHQKDPLADKAQNFVLHVADDLELSRDAYEKVCGTLTPLVDDCTLLLTEELLEEILLPAPMKASELAIRLVEVMESNPDAHPDWVKVLHALVLSAIGTSEDDDTDDECGQVVDRVLNRTGGKVDVDVRAADRKGNTVLHLAKSGKNIQHVVKKATEKMSETERKQFLNQPNQEGKVPLHSAFHEDKPEVVAELIKAGADLDSSTQDEDGSNPFHVAAESDSAKSIGAAHHKKGNFLQNESSNNSEKQRFVNALNTPNKKGYTPLMLSVNKGYLNSAVIFLQAEANPDVQHTQTGDTALHLAAERGDSAVVKALLAFGADVKIKNGKGKTPLDVAHASTAKGGRDCVNVLEEIIQLMTEAASQVSNTFEPLPVPSNAVFLLSLDGGGTRGLLLTQTLIAIHKRMKELKPDCGPIHKYFDYVAGTSAGGLVTLSLVCANASLEATRASLFKAGDEICSLTPTFPAKVVANTSQETYGEDTRMSDIQKPRVIVMTVLADRNPPALHLMCNYGEAKNEQKPPSEWKAWEVSRATSAAPFYFPPFDEKFVDGGVMANNPTLDAMSEIVLQEEKEGSGARLALVVSIGTGVAPPPPKVEDVGIFVPNLRNFFKAITNLPDTLSAAINFLHLLISQATVSNGQETVRASAWCKSLGIPYYRLSVPLDKIIDLTENDKTVLTDMMYQGNKYLLKNAKELDTIARYLLSRS